ncbi:MAG: dihydroorotase [Clostridia bacterium]|nr:dihydroorotase [Clostridia bacterium]
MKYLLKNAKIYENGAIHTRDMLLDGAALFAFSAMTEDTEIIENCIIFPGFCDVHVHLREPGFSYKETIETGTLAAARGGYTAVFAMPNLNPTPDSPENLKKELEAIERGAKIKVYPYGTISVGEKGEVLSDLEGMASDVIAFSDDGRGVQSEELMLEAMKRAKALGKIIVAHCEDNSLLKGGYIHDGEYAKAHGHKGICSASEYVPIERDIELLKKCGASYHVCHVSAKESVEAIRRAKAEGVDITCETAPHYLTLDDSQLEEDGRFKMNPPIRSKEDKEALIAGILDGTVDMIATDHAPHSKEEKSQGLEKSLMGVVGIETAFPVLYTYLVKPGIIPLETIAKCLIDNPRKRFGLPSDESFTIFKLDECYKVDPEEFLSMGKATPYENCELYGKCLITALFGKAVYKNEKILR